jgi:hypothetical protein
MMVNHHFGTALVCICDAQSVRRSFCEKSEFITFSASEHVNARVEIRVRPWAPTFQKATISP